MGTIKLKFVGFGTRIGDLWAFFRAYPCLQSYCLKRGAKYLGELYDLPGDRDSVMQTWMSQFLRDVGLPSLDDASSVRWSPEYWDDAEMLAVLSTPIGEYPAWMEPQEFALSGFRLEELWGEGHYYVGQMLKALQTKRHTGSLIRFTKWRYRMWMYGTAPTSHATKFFPHACMKLPPDWQAPTKVPERVVKWQAAVERSAHERAQLKAQCDALHARANEIGREVTEEDRSNLERPIVELELPPLTQQALERLQINSLDGLARTTQEELLKRAKKLTPPPLGMHRKSIGYIIKKMADFGLNFGMKFPENWDQRTS